MKSLKKTFIIFCLSCSNLIILGLVFNSFFSNQEQIRLFSISESREDLKAKIERNCQAELTAILEGGRSSFICSVNIQQRHKGVSYSLKTRFKVSKTGDKIIIKEISGQLRNKKQHVTEARFCGDCIEDKELTDSATEDITELMKEVLILAENIYDNAQDSVEEAYQEYNQAEREKRMAKSKAEKCEGAWNEETNSFEEFKDREDKLRCLLSQSNNLNDLLSSEKFYHERLKKELWNIALSEEDQFLLEDGLLNQFKDPYRNSLSVTSSAGLLESYIRWREDYEILESIEDKQKFLSSIAQDVSYMKSLMSDKQSQQDIYYLNKGFDGLFAKLNPTENIAPPQIADEPINYRSVSEEASNSIDNNVMLEETSSPIDYEAVSQEVEKLY